MRILTVVLLAAVACGASGARVVKPFDADWRFLAADAEGAEKPDFDDSKWRNLSVPHDWSIEGPFDAKNPTGGAGGFLPAGIGWYRKTFTLPLEQKTKRVFIDFDGVMANSDVWINGAHLGKRPNGYVGFRYDLTAHVHFGGKPNVLAVRADNSRQPASRWYTGAGIYRHVRLVVADPLHIDHWATFVTTPKIAAGEATVRVTTTVVNQSAAPRTVALEVSVIDPAGKPAGRARANAVTIAASQSGEFSAEVVVRKPQRWDIDSPALYNAVVMIREGKTTPDEETVTFGIREARFEAATGFWLNGRNLKIKGVCLHHDAGALGAAVPLRAWERRLERLKEIGVNAIRTAHNPVAPEFLDLCDRMGFLVMDEAFDAWTIRKMPFDYHLYFREWSGIDVRDMVLADRNHPSVIVYSTGNEIRDTPKPEIARPILVSLLETFHKYDPTRPVTQGLFRPNVSKDYDNGFADLLDVVGQNYRENEILAAHAAKPTRKILGTENTHDRAAWLALRDNPPYAGQFLWTGIDYLGEAWRWPVVAAGSGLLDRTGEFKPMGRERQSWWSDKPMVFASRRMLVPGATPSDPGYHPLTRPKDRFPDWTPADLSPHEEKVEVASNCEEVELLLNGRSLGSKPRNADDSPRTWLVRFEPGALLAIGRNKGKDVALDALRTAGKPAAIKLTVDRERLQHEWDDVAYVVATVTDGNGVPIPAAADLIKFAVSGPGVIAAVDNGDITSHELFQAAERHAFYGVAVAIVKAKAGSGKITVTAAAEGLAEGSVVIETK